ncbi:hypothetical protein SMD44_02530 [Streptomyces alboflavus]|uniref:Uncharacterized protein n=1 Tax=Streptomyces alboflavus TaxID=67267 RepID=A0A1Z1W9L3_9ACTN|nr:hypothetical protein [Streptomyces alboflavus]ARX83116.1 hypothetical protein SMD44_02530 [Streptomyces alboflavus]
MGALGSFDQVGGPAPPAGQARRLPSAKAAYRRTPPAGTPSSHPPAGQPHQLPRGPERTDSPQPGNRTARAPHTRTTRPARPGPHPRPQPSTPAITADGAYAARLAHRGGCWFPERWTLDTAEPYAVPLPAHQPEEPGTRVLPMADGRVLVHRRAAGRHLFSLLYPTGPSTGEVPLGGVECEGADLTLLPPAPRGAYAYALAVGARSTAVWMVAGGSFGPEHLAEIPGRCTGGVWLDRTNRMLALDRDLDGPTKTVAVDLERGGEVTPLLQIAADSDDRLLLADADSGLLLIRSDAPGETRLGWGVLGSTRPVRFPECLRMPGRAVTPFAIQPGQVLMPESCTVALRVDDGSGNSLPRLCGWRPSERRVHQLAAPEGWLSGAGRCTRDGVLELPYVTGTVPCGMARVEVPSPAPGPGPGSEASGQVTGVVGGVRMARPVPLQQAPLGGRGVGG